MSFVTSRKSRATNFFSLLSFLAVFGSGIRDLGSGMDKNQDSGLGINIPDPQHWFRVCVTVGIQGVLNSHHNLLGLLSLNPFKWEVYIMIIDLIYFSILFAVVFSIYTAKLCKQYTLIILLSILVSQRIGPK